MQKVKTREEIANQIYLNKADIKKLLGISYNTAVRIYDYANKMDNELPFRIEPAKVRITSVAKVVNMSLETLKKQAGVYAR
jgi:hypothetical protein